MKSETQIYFQPLLHRKSFHTLENKEDALKVLATRPNGVRGVDEGAATTADIEMVELANIHGIIFPWTLEYRIFWYLTVVGAIFTVFFAPFQVAFEDEPGTFNDLAGWIELGLNLLFTIDIVVNCNLAFYKDGLMVFEHEKIFKEYVGGMFWVDIIGVFPFETAALMVVGKLGGSTTNVLLFSLFRLLRFVRLHRMSKLSEILQYNARVSLLWFTLLRNFAVVLSCAHVEACSMYFIARLYNFGEDTWLGPLHTENLTILDRYVTALYMSIVTFATVGYGDYSPRGPVEQIVGSVFMLLNIVVAAWVIGSITLLIVKGDEKTGEYRDSLETLHQYGMMHNFDTIFLNKLKRQLRLEFNNREIADEQVLKHFPSAVRRKILRRLYLEPLVKTQLMKGVREQFVDAFLTSCTVEIFSPGEEIVERGSILSDIFLLVGGIAEITTGGYDDTRSKDDSNDRGRYLEAGDFVGEIGFFTESPQVDSVSSLTVCKTLTITRSAYKLLSQDHPGSAGKILHNLLAKVKEMALQIEIPKRLTVLRAGSSFDFDIEAGYGSLSGNTNGDKAEVNRRKELTAIEDLVKMHMSKQLDDQTTRLLFAASRGDTSTIALMCDHDFDPNNADYDHRTALMVSAMKGNTDVAKMLLGYKVCNTKLHRMSWRLFFSSHVCLRQFLTCKLRTGRPEHD